MAVATPETMTATFEAAYNERDKARLLRLYTDDAVHTFDGRTVSEGPEAISRAFDRGFASSIRLKGRTLTCMATADTALLRVLWQFIAADGAVLREAISCEVLAKGGDGLWRYIIDDASGGSRAAEPATAQ